MGVSAPGDIWYSLRQVAHMLRLSERTVQQAIRDGQLVARRLSPRKTIIRWADVEKWRARVNTP